LKQNFSPRNLSFACNIFISWLDEVHLHHQGQSLLNHLVKFTHNIKPSQISKERKELHVEHCWR
jgi:hypothetical protein